MELLQLFWSFLQVGLFTIGGGYASLPIVQEQVLRHGWMTMPEFGDLLTISQMTPGPIAINLATFVGYRYDGILGGIVATFAYVLPSFIIVSILALLYRKYSSLTTIQGALAGLRPATIGLIFSAGLSIVWMALFGDVASLSLPGAGSINMISAAIFVLGFASLRTFKLPPPLLIALCGLAGGIMYFVL